MSADAIALTAIGATLTIFCLGIAFHAGSLAARVDANEKRLDRFEALVLNGLAKLEKLILNGSE